MSVKNQGLSENITFSFASDGSNESLITVQVLDNNGLAITEPVLLDIWLSILPTGVISTDAPSGNLDVDSDGVLVYPLSATTSRHIIAQTGATGKVVLTLTDTANDTVHYRVCAQCPYSGRVSISAPMAEADFGA